MCQQDRFVTLDEFSVYGISSLEEPNKRDVSKPLFGIRSWHRPYAKALLEHEPAKLEVLIREAELAILGRFLEVCTCSIQTDEILDLQDAAEVLSQFKKEVGHARQVRIS